MAIAIAHAPNTRPYLPFDDDDDSCGEEPDFLDPEECIDDIDDEEWTPRIMKQKSRESDSVDSVVVDGVPATTEDEKSPEINAKDDSGMGASSQGSGAGSDEGKENNNLDEADPHN